MSAADASPGDSSPGDSSLEAEQEAWVAELCAEGRLGDAAALLAGAGLHLRAARILERACEFAAASEQACSAEAWPEAIRLAALSGEDAAMNEALDGAAAALDEESFRRVAASLVATGHHRYAAVIYERVDDRSAAATAWERGGRALEAARCFEEAGEPAQAARILEGALRAKSEVDVGRLRAQLGRLYARHGKHEAAVRVLQSVETTSASRRDALPWLARSLEALGLRQPLRDLEAELVEAGITQAMIEAPDEAAAEGHATLYGRYRVAREVAVTPHARLFEAIDAVSGDRVAVKILAAAGQGTGRDALSRFVREAKALEQIRHPNVVPLREYVPAGPALILAWMAGGSLRDLLDREPVSPARAAEIARAVLDALAEAHRLGILHRDVKPSNLLFDAAGTAKLADFGAAHLASSAATVTVGAIGTVAYMAPEQRAGKAASVASDLYAAGVLLHEMLTRALPADARGVVSSSHPDLGPAHDALIARFLADEPKDRFATALEARRAVEALAWSTRVVAQKRGETRVATSDDDERTAPARRAGEVHDTWLGRDVRIVAWDQLDRVAAFARCGHPVLATVLRADEPARQLWIELPRGRPLSQGITLTRAQRQSLRGGVEALHAAGAAHGSIDPEHVLVHGPAVRLAFPAAPGAASVEADLTALEQLGA